MSSQNNPATIPTPTDKTGNLKIYNEVRSVPVTAQKEIKGGRLIGKTDINPMWRIKALTEQFGPCGVGWRSVIKKQWTEPACNGEAAAFVEIELFIRVNDNWSEAIPGIGGSMFITNEKSGPYVSDECYKMAYTDALSVACKALGIGADVYWEKDSNKYDRVKEQVPVVKIPQTVPVPPACEQCGTIFSGFEHEGKSYTAEDAYNMAFNLRGAHICKNCSEENKVNTGG